MLSGKLLKQGLLNAAQALLRRKDEVDALNVFPVPDGDTGTNMSMTVQAAARELRLLGDDVGFDATAEKAASAMLRGARGNSGVILSLIFRGFAQSVKGSAQVGAAQLAEALRKGSEAAYKAVMKPTEGTILTVVREAADAAVVAAATPNDDAVVVWESALQGARAALAKTPQMLPVLKQAGVVDAGGQGLVYIMDGILQGLNGLQAEDLPVDDVMAPSDATVAGSGARLDTADIEFAYCTEFLVERTNDAAQTDTDLLRNALAELGDCVVVVDADEIIKVHVHNNSPGTVLNLAQEYGQFVQLKVENMRKQHSETQWADGVAPAAAPVQTSKRFGIVAVATGNGVAEMLEQYGVDVVVTGGQSMNPSTEDLLQAVNATPAEHVFLLPNNKNIIMAAEQVDALTNRGVSVVQTRSVVQGVAAVLEFDESQSIEVNHVQMQRAAERVQTGLVTYAARESQMEGLDIKEGSVIGLENGKLTVTEQDPVVAAYRVARHLVRHSGGTMVTVYAGEDVTEEQTTQLVEQLEKQFGNKVEVQSVVGGQPMYYFMLAVE